VKGSFLPALPSRALSSRASSSRALSPRVLSRFAVVAAVALPLLAPALAASASTPLTVLAGQRAVVVTTAVAGATTTATVVPTSAVAIHATARVVTRAPVVRTTLGVRAITEARKHFGAPYRWGATGPRSFDCSGLTHYVFARLGVRLPRTAAAQYSAIHHIAPSHKRVGDLIFKYNSGGIYHVGIYAGNGRMIAATHTGDVVRYSPVSGRYKVGRVR
jgi:cell wall-associated NlpC family hydrolase